jgi:hypothetical protein
MAKRPGQATSGPKSGAARSAAGKVGMVGKARNSAKGAAARAKGTVGRAAASGRAKTSSQIAAAKRNLERARNAIKRKAGGTAALRLKVGAKRLISKAKAKAIGVRTKVRGMIKKMKG